jgi:hypothetical protein
VKVFNANEYAGIRQTSLGRTLRADALHRTPTTSALDRDSIPQATGPGAPCNGGEGIRTPDAPKGIPDFKSGAFNRSATPPTDPTGGRIER